MKSFLPFRIILTLLPFLPLFTQELTDKTFIGEPDHYLSFTEFNVTYENSRDPSLNFEGYYVIGKEGPYRLLKVNDLRFILLQSKYSLILLSRTEGFPDITGSLVMADGAYYPQGDLQTWSRVEVSSEAKGREGACLNTAELTPPWAEGDVGPGKNSKIRLWSNRDDMKSLIVFNGYIDPDKTWLYKYYGRVKELEIALPADGVSFHVYLDDVPDPQFIMLPAVSDYVELIIKDVYPGSLYDDTCLAGVFSSFYRNYF